MHDLKKRLVLSFGCNLVFITKLRGTTFDRDEKHLVLVLERSIFLTDFEERFQMNLHI